VQLGKPRHAPPAPGIEPGPNERTREFGDSTIVLERWNLGRRSKISLSLEHPNDCQRKCAEHHSPAERCQGEPCQSTANRIGRGVAAPRTILEPYGNQRPCSRHV